MKYYATAVLFLILLCTQQTAKGQQPINSDLEQQLETVAASSNPDYSTFSDQLELYHKHPLNLNTATNEQLQSLQLLSEMQLTNLKLHIKHYGILLTVYELQSVDGFDLKTIEQILPYVTVTTGEPGLGSLKRIKKGNFTTNLRYHQNLTNQKNNAPQALLNQYRFNYNNQLLIGSSLQKNTGEKLSSAIQNRGYYSGYLLARTDGFIKTLALGDYQVAFGQGLSAWQSIYFVKTINTININRSGFMINPHTSAGRTNYLRGIAATAGYKKLELTTFISHLATPETLAEQDTLGSEPIIYNASSNTIIQNTYGTHLRMKRDKFQIGVTAILNKSNKALEPKHALYNQFTFKGKQLATMSMDYNYVHHNYNLFGEAAVSDNGGVAYLNGLIVSLDERLAVSVLQRNYQPGYQSIFANAFSENTKPANEKGIYIGTQITLNRHFNIAAYYDQFRFPWLKYQVNAPSEGNERMLQVNYNASKKMIMYAGFHQKLKMSNRTLINKTYVAYSRQTNYRYQVDYEMLPVLKLRTRIELTVLDTGKNLQQGFLIYQDINYKPQQSKFDFNFRYGLFDTDNYNTRIYGYENNVPGAYSLPAYYDKGMYCYFMAKYSISSKITFWLRYSYVLSHNTNYNGTLSKTEETAKSAIKIFLRISL